MQIFQTLQYKFNGVIKKQIFYFKLLTHNKFGLDLVLEPQWKIQMFIILQTIMDKYRVLMPLFKVMDFQPMTHN